MNPNSVKEVLIGMQDRKYASFQARLIPTIDKKTIIGVRTPQLRQYAKMLAKQGHAEAFLQTLPHQTFEENQLHAFLLSEEKEFQNCITKTEKFLPFVDNWATCDQLSPKVFAKFPECLLPYIKKWIISEQPYTVRFAIGMLMRYFLEDRFLPIYPGWVAAVRSQEYYITMMAAWYFATALAKQYDAVLPYITEKRLTDPVHRQTIRKSIESNRIPPERKAYLKQFR